MRQMVTTAIDLSLGAFVADSIKLLRENVPTDGQPYWGCFSGGKDSCVIKELARVAGVPVEWHYNVTTIDPPELVRFIRREHPDVSFDRPKHNFFTVALKRGFPTRRVRWCCEEFKEKRSPKGRVLIFGVRAAESARRAKAWTPVTWHHRQNAPVVCPIIEWSDVHVWEYIRRENIPYCKLYDEGFKRLGCIGCPMAGQAGREREFARWPGYERKWKQLFRDIWQRRTGSQQRDGREWFGNRFFDNWEEMWDWWMSDDPLPGEKTGDGCQDQLDLFS